MHVCHIATGATMKYTAKNVKKVLLQAQAERTDKNGEYRCTNVKPVLVLCRLMYICRTTAGLVSDDVLYVVHDFKIKIKRQEK